MSKKNVIRVDELDVNKRIHPVSIDDKWGGSRIAVIGKPGTGKSSLIKSLLYSKKHIIPSGIIFSGTEDMNGFYSQCFPSTFIFNDYDEEQLEKFIKRQKKAIKKVNNPWAICLIDDCTDDKKIFNKPTMIGCYKRGRHWKMLHILSLQYCMDLSRPIRSNVDGVFLLKETQDSTRKQLYEQFASFIPDFNTFCDLMDQLTEDYHALYIDNTNKMNDWQQNIFWYKAKLAPDDFKFGCDEIWHWHFQKYNPNEGLEVTTIA